jgi:hypothetical protein
MYTMILLLYLQRGVDVTLDGVRMRGSYRNRAACEQAALFLRGAVPIPGGYTAAWQDVTCTPIARNARVRDGPPLDLAALLNHQPPRACQGEGTWRRLAQLWARR